MKQQTLGWCGWRRSFGLVVVVYFIFLFWAAVGDPWLAGALTTFGAGSGPALTALADAVQGIIVVAAWYYFARHCQEQLPLPAPGSPRSSLRSLVPGLLALAVIAAAAGAAAITLALLGRSGAGE